MAEQAAFGHGNVQILVKESENVHIEISGAKVASLWVPPFRQTLRSGKNIDLALLLATTAITELTGRDQLWRDCLAWCNDSALGPMSVRCIAGRGGSGKTRFALELVYHLRDLPDWDGRFVRFAKSEPFDLWGKTGTNHVLLVFDYAPDNAAAIANSLRTLAENLPTQPARRLRILLLARTANWESGWLSQFKPASTLEAAQPLSTFFAPEEPIELQPLTVEDRIRVFEQAYKKVAAVLNLPTHSIDHSVFETRHANETLRDPLTLIMAAVVGLRNGVPNAMSLTRLGLAYEVADLLIASRLKQAFPENPALALHIAACATLTEGFSEQGALSALKVESETNNLGSIPNPSGFLDRLSSWLPSKIGNGLGPIEPDIVGEAFVLGNKTPHLANPQATILRLVESRGAHVVQFLIRATQDFCLADRESRTEPLEWLEQLIAKGNADDLPLLFQIHAALPESSVVLRPSAVSIRQMIVERVLSRVSQLGWEVPFNVVSGLAWFMSRLAISQNEVGQRQQALRSAEGAVHLARQLVAHNRDNFLPGLADALLNLTTLLNNTQGALETAQETVALYKELTQRNREKFLHEFAKSLNNLALFLSEVGDRDLALDTAKQAIDLFRELVERDRKTYLPDLAMSLNTLANRQAQAELCMEALATAEQAIEVHRELVQLNRDAYLPDLGMSLNTLANRQGEAAQPQAAMASAQESASIYEELVQRNREAFLPGLAKAVNNLANRQNLLGKLTEALDTGQRALNLRIELAQRDDAYIPDLAKSYGTLGSVYHQLHQYSEAAQMWVEGISIILATIEKRPVAPHIDLAVKLLTGYMNATRLGAIKPDQQLLSEASRVLGPYLNQEGDSL
jgi:tetratricopeptide (TPR) repeat protein